MTTTTTIPSMNVGDRVRFWTPIGGARRWWTVRASDARFTVLTRQAEFELRGVLLYTIVDRDRDLRGPCNLIGQGWGAGVLDDGECAALLRALQRDALSIEEIERLRDEWDANPEAEDPTRVEVSYRNNVEVRLRDHVRVDVKAAVA